ncbi:MAG: antibiotic biosynthesis monooxygenase [Gemmatimonadota bacterium]
MSPLFARWRGQGIVLALGVAALAACQRADRSPRVAAPDEPPAAMPPPISFDTIGRRFTVITIYTTDSASQAQVMDAVRRALPATIRRSSGFVVTALLRSLDGRRVLRLSQWNDERGWEAFSRMTLPQDSLTWWLAATARPRTVGYELAACEARRGLPELEAGQADAVEFVEFRLHRKGDQRPFIAAAKQAARDATVRTAALEFAAVLRGVDTSSVGFIARWQGRPGSSGLARPLVTFSADTDQRLYEVVEAVYP